MMSYDPHPLASIFPPMTDDQFAELVADIDRNGLIESITLYQGKILDGIHRARACDQLDRTIKFCDYNGDDPIGFVISKNLRRRHLDESQRAMVAASISDLEVGSNQWVKGGQKRPSTREVAQSLKVGQTSVKAAKKVKRKGAPEVIAAVESGELSVSAAAQIVDEPDHEQQKRELKTRKIKLCGPSKKPPKKEVVAKLNSILWSTASLAERQKFISAVGIRSLFEAMSDADKDWIYRAINHVPLTAIAKENSIPDDLSIPGFLRR